MVLCAYRERPIARVAFAPVPPAGVGEHLCRLMELHAPIESSTSNQEEAQAYLRGKEARGFALGVKQGAHPGRWQPLMPILRRQTNRAG